MKRLVAFFLFLAVALSVSACTTRNRTDVTRERIVEAYKEAGYEVWSREYDEPLDHGQIAYVQADHPDGNYIYFSIFATEAEAKAYKKEFYHPGMMGLFSLIFGDPSWQRWEVHGCIVVQYDEPDYFVPFDKLLKGK